MSVRPYQKNYSKNILSIRVRIYCQYSSDKSMIPSELLPTSPKVTIRLTRNNNISTTIKEKSMSLTLTMKNDQLSTFFISVPSQS